MMAAWFRGAEEDPGGEEEEEGLWEYDSTWEDEGEEEDEGRDEGREEEERKESAAVADTPRPGATRPPRRGRSPSAKQEWRKPNRSAMGFGRYKSASRRNWMAAKDMQRYRHNYPDLEETDTETQEEEMWNLSFYKNEISFVPRGLHIEDLLETWQHDYAIMEENHSYIQWLFPLREQGMNWRAKLLTCNEIKAFRKSKEVMDRFVRAYKLMLGFYGIELIDEKAGELRRADNYLERFWNLNQYTHNNLRITRILKCLGEMGKEHYQVHLVKFFLTETLVHQTLPRVMRSALDYFMFTVRDKQKRRELVHFAWQHFEPKHEFVWGRRKKLMELKPRSPELPNKLALKEEQELAKDGEGVEENKSQSPNEIRVVGNAADGSNDNAKEQPESEECTSELQLRPLSKHKTLETTEECSPGSVADVKAEGEDMKEGSLTSKMKADGKDSTSDSGSGSGGGTDSESLKESKKRKFETNRSSGESVKLSRSPTDIEKISSNLEEVVIGQDGPGSLQLTEKAKSSIEEGDSQDLKEGDSIRAVVKRRKVDEVASDKRVTKTAAKLDTEVTSFESRTPSFKMAVSEKADKVCPAEFKISNSETLESQNDCRTADGPDGPLNSKTTGTSDLPSSDPVPDTSNECVATSTVERELSQPCPALIANSKQETGDPGQEEAGMKGKAEDAVGLDGKSKATENITHLAEADTEKNPR